MDRRTTWFRDSAIRLATVATSSFVSANKMERETWLYPNRRAVWFAALPAAIVFISGIYTIGWVPNSLATTAGSCAVIAACLLLAAIAGSSLQPRLAYFNDHLLVYLRAGQPIRLPIEIVECFFLGRGPTMLRSGVVEDHTKDQVTSNIVVRLAESAAEWKEVEVQRILGQWRDGYITIRGTWCEPINGDLVRELNHKLVAAHRRRRAAQEPQRA
jgi:hypothetical protein